MTTADTGQSPPPPILRRLERGLRADLSALRVHTGPDADRRARALGADAFTSGSHVYFRHGAYRPETPAGFRLLAHEAAHAVQQALGGVGTGIGRTGDRWERQADRWADAVAGGRTRQGARVVVPPGGSPAIQRHVSYEHRILGDAPTKNLLSITANAPDRGAVLDAQIQLQNLWRDAPQKVTEQDIDALKLGIRTLRIGPDAGLLVTYGELNALPDYLANAGAFGDVPTETLLGILQCIRQESFNQLTGIRTGRAAPNDEFAYAASAPWKLDLINDIVETSSLDEFTSGLGFLGEDHYQGLLARNACHFAPFSWYRWQSFHLVARNLAQRSYLNKRDPELARQALMYNGYADHFLQDSFAAGHLVNKTLVMQWFIEWAAGQNLLPVADWDQIKNMTAAQQPGLAGLGLYDPAYNGPSNDPQTSQEAATLVRRALGSGLVADTRLGLGGTYQNYLTFLTGAVAQLGSAMLHNHYNDSSLYVSSVQQPTPYVVWGDATLLTGAGGSAGVEATSTAAQQSQQAILDLLTQGDTDITVQSIRDRFPSRAGDTSASMTDLKSWATGQKASCEDMFSDFGQTLKQLLVGLASPRLGVVSQDQNFGSVWAQGLPNESLTYAPVELLLSEKRLFAASDGYAYELAPGSGKLLNQRLLTDLVGVGDYTATLTSDGTSLFCGTHGYVYYLSLDEFEVTQQVPLGGKGSYHPVDLALSNDGESLFAGSNGYVYELAPDTGDIENTLLLGSTLGVGDYTTQVTTDGTNLYAGVHGYVYAVDLGNWKQPAWSTPVGGNLAYVPASVLLHDGRLFAGCNGYVYELDPGTGKILGSLLVAATVGIGGYTTQIDSDGFNLYAGVHGYAYAIDLDTWQKASWSTGLGGVGVYAKVTVNAAAGRLFAGSNGYVYELDPGTGKILHSLLMTSAVGTGDYTTTVVPDGWDLYTGVHGYASKVLTNNASPDGNLYLNTQDEAGDWQDWVAGFDGAPSAVRSVTAITEDLAHVGVFAIGSDGTGHHNELGTTKGWTARFGGQDFTMRSLAVAPGGMQYVQAFAVGDDGTVHYNQQVPGTGDRWSTWQADFMDAPKASCVAAFSGAYPPQETVSQFFAVGLDGVLYQNQLTYDDDGDPHWQGWVAGLNGAPTGLQSVTVALSPVSSAEVFGIGQDGTLFHTARDTSGTWSPWESDFMGAPKIQDIAWTLDYGNEHLMVLAVGVDGSLHQARMDAGWYAFTPMDGPPGLQSAVIGRGPVNGGFIEAFGLDAHGVLYRTYQDDNGSWHDWQPRFQGAPTGVQAVTMARVDDYFGSDYLRVVVIAP
ncbi:eCIS core domain-containing protein [Streptomyces sp. 4F14]|uniref:eCIS core domain-containing protein n=1 Tax=Streptomyces sp. 4F14 TaxID=3394380 RepID=UPI003A8AA1D4